MKTSEKRRALYDAISDIDPALIQEATMPRQAKVLRTVWSVAAAAAMVAILIGVLAGLPFGLTNDEEYVTAPGTLSIRAYALDENEISEVNSTVLEEGVELPWEYMWSTGISQVPICYGMPITLDFPTEGYQDMQITFDITATDGSFQKMAEHYFDPIKEEFVWDTKTRIGSDITVDNHTTIYWNWERVEYDHFQDDYVFSGKFAQGSSFIDIIIRADNIIIGYAVVEIYAVPHENDMPTDQFMARVLSVVSFPKIDEKNQKVSKGYVSKKFKELHEAD